MMVKLSKQAEDVLINTEARQGAKVRGAVSALLELKDAHLIGPDSGLTRKGTIARERVFTARLDKAFS